MGADAAPPTSAAVLVGRPTRDGTQAPAARRVLDAAAPLFYGRGVRAVSADAVIEAAGVTKTTFYRHFPTKDDLVVAYLAAVSEAERQTVGRWRDEASGRPGEVLLRYARTLAQGSGGAGFRGCPFLNALAAHPEPDHPVHRAAQQHRRWLRQELASLLTELGCVRPDRVALELVMLRDGAMTAAEDVAPDALGAALVHAGRAVLGQVGRSGDPGSSM